LSDNFCQLHVNKTKILKLIMRKIFFSYFSPSITGNCCTCKSVSSGGCYSISFLSAEAWEHAASCVS